MPDGMKSDNIKSESESDPCQYAYAARWSCSCMKNKPLPDQKKNLTPRYALRKSDTLQG
jgi:hypothetical protein